MMKVSHVVMRVLDEGNVYKLIGRVVDNRNRVIIGEPISHLGGEVHVDARSIDIDCMASLDRWKIGKTV